MYSEWVETVGSKGAMRAYSEQQEETQIQQPLIQWNKAKQKP